MSDQNYEVKINLAGNLKKGLDESGKSSKKFENAIDSAKKSLGGLTKAAFSLQGAIVAALAGFSVKKVVDAANKQEDAINKLNSSLAQTGIYSRESSEDLQKFASELQSISRFGDEVILENAALIQSLGRLDSQGLKKATLAAADLSAALGIDLASASTLVGKAASGEVGTFSRYGLVIKRGATNAETFANALQKINENFGGRAAADALTFSGATQQLSNSFGDLLEVFGQFLTESPALKAAISVLKDVVTEAANSLSKLKPSFISGLNEIIKGSFSFLRAIVSVFDAVIRTIKASFSTINTIFKTAEGAFKLIKGDFAGFKKAAIESASASKEIGKAFTEEALPSVQDFLVKTEVGFDATYKKIVDGANGAVKNITKEVKKESFLDFLIFKAGELKTYLGTISEEIDKGGIGGLLKSDPGKKLTESAGQAAGFLKQGAAGAAGALAAGADLIAPGLGQVVQLLSLSKDELKAAIRGFIDAIPEVISTIIENIPVLFTELIAGIPRLIDAFVSKIDVIIFAFVDGMIEAAPKIAAGIGKAIIKYIGSGGGIGSIFGFSQGGVTPNYGPSNKDIYPSMLSRGERVLTADQNNLFEKMLAVMEQNKNQTIEVKNGPMNLNANLMLDKRVLANVFLDISRSNMRTA